MLLTNEGKNLNKDCPLSEYPTPQFARDSYLPLNGLWEFGIDHSLGCPKDYGQRILVPFSVETPLSGINHPISKEDVLHYKKSFVLPKGFNKGRLLLHFEAVDQIADVYLNGSKIYHHEGGYFPFCVDMLEAVEGENTIQVDVKDDTSSPVFPRGKQSDKPGGIWYTPTSGIWGSVWIESVPKEVIRSLRLTPKFDEKIIDIKADFEGKITSAEAFVSYKGKELGRIILDQRGHGVFDLSNFFYPWSPSDPSLYDLKVKINEDEVTSYFAMRKFSKILLNGHYVFGLNDKPLFLSGVLDQGYFPDGGLTPPSEAAMLRDLQMVKTMGFNLIRKHIKIENMRWYYHCDRLGLLVNQDFVSGGSPYKPLYIMLRPFFNFGFDDKNKKVQKKLGRGDQKSRSVFISDISKTVERLYNCPCICSWTIFNEGWGQFDSLQCFSLLKILDSTRLIDVNSGWYDQGIGDFSSHHVYFRKVRLHNDSSRILSLSEFGGYSYRVEEHSFSKKNFAYKSFKTDKELTRGLIDLYSSQVLPLIKKEGLSVSILTQLSDVEEETNGLVSYDRAIVKVDEKAMASINSKLNFD